jgi:hypothetical protein
MTLRTAGALVFVLALAAPFLPAAVAGHSTTTPLTNEDVVRMVMTRTPEKEVLAAIDKRPVDFDLSVEMVAELRQAGVGETVIEAMRRRQAAMPKTQVSPTPTPAPGRTGTLRIDFPVAAGDDKSPAEFSAIALKSLPKGMRRRGGMEVGLMSDMALVVLCISADHVPDHWDTRSPLQGAPRHELLLFRPGSATEKIKGHEVLYLAHQPSYEIPLPEGTHNIVVGAAGKQAGSGTWRLLQSDGARLTIDEGRSTRVAVEARSAIKGSTMTGFDVDSAWKIVAVEVLDSVPPEASATATPDPESRP